MRSPRGPICKQTKYFHIESVIADGLENIAPEEAFKYQQLLQALATIYGCQLLFWIVHPRGIDLLVKRQSLKDKNTDSNSTIQAYQVIGEVRIAASLELSNKIKLHAEEQNRLFQFRENYGDLQRFVQSLKQRISMRYNVKRGRTGPIWQDRARIFPLRDRVDELIEVAAFILARAAKETDGLLNRWPSTFRQLIQGDTHARDGLNQLLRSSYEDAELIDLLRAAQSKVTAEIDNSLASKGKGKGSGSGRKAAWRPKCEREYVPTQNTTNSEYVKIYEQARIHFYKMLDRYHDFRKETGLDIIPYGYKDDSELRKWAAALRGKFKQGRLPEWKLKELEDTSILSPPITRGGKVATKHRTLDAEH